MTKTDEQPKCSEVICFVQQQEANWIGNAGHTWHLPTQMRSLHFFAFHTHGRLLQQGLNILAEYCLIQVAIAVEVLGDTAGHLSWFAAAQACSCSQLVCLTEPQNMLLMIEQHLG